MDRMFIVYLSWSRKGYDATDWQPTEQCIVAKSADEAVKIACANERVAGHEHLVLNGVVEIPTLGSKPDT